MQSYSDVSGGVDKKLTVAENNCQIKGKENCTTTSACFQENKQTVTNAVAHGPQKSKLPVLSKTRAPPDFQKMHQTWQTYFQRGKAICKKSCTRPQPFNFSQRVDRSRVQVADVRISATSSNEKPSCTPPANCKSREPLSEVALSLNIKESSVVMGGSEVEFKVDPSALASILSDIGVSAAPVGKVSLAQRVPIRTSSIAHLPNSSRNSMIRSSVSTAPNGYTRPANLDRMSCISKMTVRANEQKPLSRPQCKNNPITETTVKGGLKKDAPHPQENPLLQQMNPPPRVQTSDKTSCSITTQEDNSTNLTSVSAVTDKISTVLSTPLCETSSTELNVYAEKKDSVKKTDSSSVEFVADSQALANILSHTELNNPNCRKQSLAQRVPVQGRSSMFKGGMALSGSLMMQMTTPKPSCGPMSNVSLKDVMFSPCRVPLVTSDKSSGGSARRVFQPQSSTVKFSQLYSVTSKQPVFPKTPRTLALEKANKCHKADKTDVQTSSKSSVKWADELSPSPLSGVLCEREPGMEEVAMRLILDGEGPGDPEKKKESPAVSHPLIVLESPPTISPQQKELAQPEAHGANVWDSQDFQLHSQMHLAPSVQPSSSSSSSVSCIKSSVPLSFLSHPAVQALKSCSSGPCSLPDIARLRLQAAVSAKQRFWEARLDEECAFYTSREASGPIRSCRDPVSLFLDKQEDMHFTPICTGKS